MKREENKFCVLWEMTFQDKTRFCELGVGFVRTLPGQVHLISYKHLTTEIMRSKNSQSNPNFHCMWTKKYKKGYVSIIKIANW